MLAQANTYDASKSLEIKFITSGVSVVTVFPWRAALMGSAQQPLKVFFVLTDE
ncbi:hypothetical protein BDV33DRAFT_211157 [Aspergillus novoparasiticus]|uniref:Uncharacterized protein n=1 Tax=Aspergillus novoparasiticus TaxID=986946 RepID=A0A5N6E5H8_9EURO|nr:hypothetical protein BDV33DRAFT_211157 [Aspergillus novoparasiticus]